MISKNKQKFIQSLKQKKQRQQLGLFIVEGEKNLIEILNSDFVIQELYVTPYFYDAYAYILQDKKYIIAPEAEINRLSNLQTNNSGIAIIQQKENIYLEKQGNEIVVVLDSISDPGNLGTIIRTCDWYGINKIILDTNSVEYTNPKVISSTMGSIKRVNLFYTDLAQYFEDKNGENIYGAVLDGVSIYTVKTPLKGYLIVGNESNGISKDLEAYITKKVTIPKIGNTESLNVGVATAVILDNITRK